MNSHISVSFALLLVIYSARFCWGQQTEDDTYFENSVRLLLAKRCFECHRRKAEGGLRLDSAAAIASGGVSGPAVVPGDPANSLIWQAVAGIAPAIQAATIPIVKALRQP